MKFLSPIAKDVLSGYAESLGTSLDSLVEDFDRGLKPPADNHPRRLVEFYCWKAIKSACPKVGEKITDGSFSRLTYDMMLAWENPSPIDSEPSWESVSKQEEDKRIPLEGNERQMHDDIPLFYSDVMPLLVNEEASIGENAFVWFVSLIPLAADAVNAQFTFETFTAPTASRLHFPAYDRFLKEIYKCIKYLETKDTPTGVELSKNEFILHVEGTSGTQRVVRHIGATSWPGRLTLTNKALYFEASGVMSYENALKIDLSRTDVDHKVKAASTGPWGAPLFDKAIAYESPEISEPIVLEFPEMTSSTRRDHWLALVKEVILLHHFISKFNIEDPLQAWEIHARTGLGVFRLHAARELLRISPPAPDTFLIFSLYNDLPKGDYVLAELANAIKQKTSLSACNATSILEGLNISCDISPSARRKESFEEQPNNQAGTLTSLGTTIDRVREEAKMVSVAKATVEGIEEEGLIDSLLVLAELVSLVKYPWDLFKKVISWESPVVTLLTLVMILTVTYREWFGAAMATTLLSVAGIMMWCRINQISGRYREIVVRTSTEKTTVESIVAAQHNLKSMHELVKTANIGVMRIWSLLIGKAPQQASQMMCVLSGVAVLLMVIPFKYVLMGSTLCSFAATSKIAEQMSCGSDNRRLREWWESIPIIPVRTASGGPN